MLAPTFPYASSLLHKACLPSSPRPSRQLLIQLSTKLSPCNQLDKMLAHTFPYASSLLYSLAEGLFTHVTPTSQQLQPITSTRLHLAASMPVPHASQLLSSLPQAYTFTAYSSLQPVRPINHVFSLLKAHFKTLASWL